MKCNVSGAVPAATVQWLKDGSPISGETALWYQFTGDPTNDGDYSCTATNNLGTVTSAPVPITFTGLNS